MTTKARVGASRMDDYQQDCLRTANDASLAVVALGIAGEAGEVCDLVKKHVGHGHSLDRDEIIEELGDLLWYVAVMAASLDVKLSDVAGGNTQKLKVRYPNGFDVARSINR